MCCVCVCAVRALTRGSYMADSTYKPTAFEWSFWGSGRLNQLTCFLPSGSPVCFTCTVLSVWSAALMFLSKSSHPCGVCVMGHIEGHAKEITGGQSVLNGLNFPKPKQKYLFLLTCTLALYGWFGKYEGISTFLKSEKFLHKFTFDLYNIFPFLLLWKHKVNYWPEPEKGFLSGITFLYCWIWTFNEKKADFFCFPFRCSLFVV